MKLRQVSKMSSYRFRFSLLILCLCPAILDAHSANAVLSNHVSRAGTPKAGTKAGGGEGKRGTSMQPKDMAAALRKHGRGGVYGPVPLDPGPPCCQICPGKVYHELSLLQLDEKIERVALDRFHKYVGEFEIAKKKRQNLLRKDKEKKQQRESKSTADIEMRQDNRKKQAHTGALQMQERFRRGRSLSGIVPVPDYMWVGSPLSRGPMANVLTTTGTLDVLHQMETKAAQQVPEHTLKGGRTTPPERSAPNGASNRKAGPCCSICAQEFIPEERADEKEQRAQSLAPVQPQARSELPGPGASFLEAQERLSKKVDGAAQTEHGKNSNLLRSGLTFQSSANNNLQKEKEDLLKERTTEERGPSNPIPGKEKCCNVCGDELSPERDIEHVRISEVAFLQVKAIVTTELETLGRSPYRPFEYDPHATHVGHGVDVETRKNSLHGTRNVFEVPAFMEQASSHDSRSMAPTCCTMCPTIPNGGWLGSEPFQDPRSEEQMLNDQINDPDLMRNVAFRRTYYNQFTQDPVRAMGFKKATEAMMKASNIIAQSNLPGGAGLATFR